MGGNRRQPPKPPAQPPVASSKAKDYRMDRPSEVMDELDALRSRGIAKVLNRHFTDTTKKLAKEKAAADAALADLQRRRAQTSTFVASKGGDLNPFDSMYVELQQKRAECRRKERETLLLYQRYVHTYGAGAGASNGNSQNNTSSKTSAKGAATVELSPATSSSTSTLEVPPPPSPVPTSSSTQRTTTLQPLDENNAEDDEVTVNSEVNFSSFYNKRIQEKQKVTMMDPPTILPSEQEATALDAPAALLVEALTPPRPRQHELKEPSPFVWHINNNNAGAHDPPEKESPRSAGNEPDLVVVLGNGAKKNKESGDAIANGGKSLFGKADPPAADDPPAASNDDDHAVIVLQQASSNERATLTVENDSEKDANILRKELFSEPTNGAEENRADAPVDSTTTTTTPPVETKIKEATAERLEIISYASSDANRPTREVTTEVPSPAEATEDEEEDDDRSVISGLTMNSHMTRQVMEAIELEMNRFLNTETEAIRKILDDEEENTHESTTLDDSFSIIGDQTKRASMKAEAMAKEMQKILDEYAKEDLSESHRDFDDTGDADTVGDTVATSTTIGYPKKYETSDPTKHWMVYYDEKFQREYYFEKNSKTTQWEAPGASQSESRQFSEDVSPNSFTRTRSRRDIYRKKIRRRRVRRFAAFSLLVLGVGGTVYHWQTNHPDKTYHGAMVASLQSTKEVIVDALDVSLYAIANQLELVKDQIDNTFTDKKTQEEEQAAVRKLEEMEKKRIAQELLLVADKERERVQAAEQIEAEARSLQEEKELEEAEALKELEEAQRRQLELHAMMEANKKAEEEEAARHRDVESKALQRPWGCFLPLSYIHPRCNKLAKLRPLYNDRDVLHAFLE